MEWFFLIFGLILGSFYLVIATRLPVEENVILSRSHCDNCHETLKWYQLIPVLSFFIMKGKCPKCHKRIPLINLIIELLTGFLFMFLYMYFGLGYELYEGLVICSLLIIIFISDFKYLIINDSPLIVAGILTIVLKLIYFGIKPTLLAILSGLILFIMMYLIKLLGDKMFKRESLGGGDIKLSFIMGLILGVRLGLVSLILSSFLALPSSVLCMGITKKKEVPYGPFLIGSVFIIFLFMDKFTLLINYIMNLF